ncbi:MAG: FAD-dependent oxidoreductase [Chloroflexi bacterium]|nr:FAD-dependent oxidoreductase [Chloroflexota bacterium]
MKLKQREVDVAVIGGGPAGLAAGIKAKEEGAEHVLILERAEELGGLLPQCVHSGWGLLYFNEDLTGPEYGARFIEKANDTKVDFQLESMVIGLTPDREIRTASSKYGYSILKPKAVVLAMGCRERSRGALNIPGTRPGGVFTAGTAQRWVNIQGFIPGKRIVMLGSGDIGMIMARRLTLEGAKIELVAEILPYIGGLVRNQVQCLRDFNIPLLLEHTVTDIHGEDRVEAVTVAAVDSHRNPIPSTERKVECDSLLLSVGLIPENEVSLLAGVKLSPITGGPIVDEFRQTNVPGIFAAGNCTHVNDLVDNVSFESELAGASAAHFAAGERLEKGKITLKAGRNIRYIVPQTITAERDVTLYMRVSEPEEMVRLKVGDIMTTKALRIVMPAEMQSIPLSLSQLSKLKEGTTELTVDVEPIKKREDKKDA